MTIKLDRRGLLGLGAGFSLSALLPSIHRAQAIPARRESGTLEDVQHIVVLMQENRSFDHYLGHLSGVRGYGDRHVVRGPGGEPIWWQQRQKAENGWITPFHLPTQTTSAECVIDLDHSWSPTHAAINKGWNNQWPRHKKDMTMGYYTREDIPFHYALADAFTVCDHYFCSTPTQTHPNRFYLMSGMVDPNATGGGPILDNVDWVDRDFYPKVPDPFTWTTYPERLQDAGVSWQVYQQGLSGADIENGNFGTNVLMCFKNFAEAQPGSALHDRAMTARTLEHLKQDVLADRLPQVSWILPPAAYSEHPRWTPGYGATFIAHALDALTANPDVWSKTVFLVMYDENDGYFDHMPPPQPPTPVLPGLSTVSTDGEIHRHLQNFESQRYKPDNLPYGLGPRVPAFAISPWSTGGFVCSEVFDHTSVIRFIESRFGVKETNITPWRRAVCGDLTSAFDFSRKSHVKVPLPDTAAYKKIADASCKLPSPVIPHQSTVDDIGDQERGARPARPLPYDLAVDLIEIGSDQIAFEFRNAGRTGASFYVYRDGTTETPRRHTVEAGKVITDRWTIDSKAQHGFTILGPNGFARYFQCAPSSLLSVQARQNAAKGTLELNLKNAGAEAGTVEIRDNAYGMENRSVPVDAGQALFVSLDLSASHQWYDVNVCLSGDTQNHQRFAGHVETGHPSITDPVMGAVLSHEVSG